MSQDDSKQWEHLLSQENDPSWSDLAPLNLHSISSRSRVIYHAYVRAEFLELPQRRLRRLCLGR